MIACCCQIPSIEPTDISNEIILSLIGTFVIFLLVSVRYRFINYWRFRKLVGEYNGFEKQSKLPFTGKKYTFTFHFLKNKISLCQASDDKGNWKAVFLIDPASPFVFTGRYDYLQGNSYSGDWGFITVWVNPETNEIVIESIPKNRDGKGIVEYVLKRSNQ